MGNSTKIKFVILFGLLLVIFVFVFVMYSQIPMIEDVTLTTSSFKNEIQTEIKNSIPDGSGSKSFEAISAYSQIENEIETEEMLGKITKELKDSCQIIAQAAISENILNVSKTILHGGNWNPQNMTSIKQCSGIVQKLKYANSGQKTKSETNSKVVDRYFQALSVCSSSHGYGGVDRASSLISKANTFRSDAQLRPCKSLMSSLSSVKDNLYNAHLAHVRQLKTDDACDDFVSSATVYGRTTSTAESDIHSIRIYLAGSHKAKAKEELSSTVENISEDDW